MNNTVLLQNSQQISITYDISLADYEQFGIKSSEYLIRDYVKGPDGMVLHLVSLTKPKCCPYCQSNDLGAHDINTYELKGIDVLGKPLSFVIYHKRYKCKNCDTSVIPRLSLRYKRSKLTNSLVEHIIDRYTHENCTTYKQLAESSGLSEYYIKQIINDYCDKEFRSGHSSQELNDKDEFVCNFDVPKDKINAIFIDEVAIFGRKYLTCVYNAETGELLYWVLRNNKDAIKSFVAWAGDKLSDELSIACDMNAPFLSAYKEALPNSKLTFDRFHIMAHITKDLKAAFIKLAKRLPDSSPVNPLFFDKDKAALRVLLSRTTNFKKGDRTKLNQILKLIPDIKVLYQSYQDIIDCYDSSYDEKQFKTRILAICRDLLEVEVFNPVFAVYKKDVSLFKRCCCEFYLDSLPLVLKSANDTNTQSNHSEDSSGDSTSHKSAARKIKNSTLTTIVRRFVKNIENIAIFVSSKLTTGPIEGYNNRLKSIKAAKFGIKNLPRFMDCIRVRSRRGYVGTVKTKWPSKAYT